MHDGGADGNAVTRAAPLAGGQGSGGSGDVVTVATDAVPVPSAGLVVSVGVVVKGVVAGGVVAGGVVSTGVAAEGSPAPATSTLGLDRWSANKTVPVSATSVMAATATAVRRAVRGCSTLPFTSSTLPAGVSGCTQRVRATRTRPVGRPRAGPGAANPGGRLCRRFGD